MNEPAQILSPAPADDPLWYKDAIIYELHVKAFFDSNNDGIGDFAGLTQKLDYLKDLGVNTLWLLPFYPSPMRDDGYDIADYRNIHPDYGTRRDFRHFVRAAHRRGLRVITELVINHTSDQHSWFQAARRSPRHSAKRNFYVWSDTDKKFSETRIIFTDTEPSNWVWDPVARQYYWHRFFSHQPDLNHNNPHVVRAVTKVMEFWLAQGVDGLRLDAIPYLCVREGTSNENLPETHAVIKQMRAVVDVHYKNRMFLAEANQWPEDVRDYFGDGDECHVAYHFPLMPRMYMAIAQENRHPIIDIMHQTPDIPTTCQWAIFLRNHDELTLEMVTDRERDYMYAMYAVDRRMRLNIGIRRRLAPLLDNGRNRIELMNSLLLSMPGSPIIYYGDEIGMGDNIYLGDRNGVRTPMQWSPDRNAGFSRADPQRLYLPPIMDSVYGYEAVNVESQLRSESSLLNWMRRIIAVRKAHLAFGRGSIEFLHPGNRKVLAYLREYQQDTILCVANLARTAQPVELNLSRFRGLVPVELMGRTAFPPIGDLPYLLTLPGHGFYWFELSREVRAPSWHEERLAPEDAPMLVLFNGWFSFFPEQVESSRKALAQKTRQAFLKDTVAHYFPQQRWFAAKGERIVHAEPVDHSLLKGPQDPWIHALFRVTTDASGAQTYFLPLALAMEQDERLRSLAPFTVARVRQQARTGILADAFADEGFIRDLITAMGENREIPCAAGQLMFSATNRYENLIGASIAELTVHPPGAESSNTTVALGERLFVKGYRHLQAGINPELEMGRFLTEQANFSHIVPVAGSLEYVGQDGMRYTLAMLQAYTSNQGSGWSYTLEYLERFLEDQRAQMHQSTPEAATPDHLTYLSLIRTLGRRTGELHAALAQTTNTPAFDPEPVTTDDLQAWVNRIINEADLTLDQLAQRLAELPEPSKAVAKDLVDAREPLRARIQGLLPAELEAVKTRFHGDYHLGQVLVVANDFVIIDFEGEPARSLAERRAKHSPLKDVAGMLRSFNYAAFAALRRAVDRLSDPVPLEPLVRDWERAAEASFLEGYLAAVAESPVKPADERSLRPLIDLFTLEKALYEVRYELANRPDWLMIPAQGLLGLLQTGEAVG